MHKLLGLFLILSTACHDHTGAPGTREPDLYLGCATDENRDTFDDYITTGRIKSEASQAAKWLMPQSGGKVSKTPVPTFAWQPSPTDTGRPNGNATCSQCPTCRTHLPPVSGNAFDLHINVDGVEVYRIMTTMQTFTPESFVYSTWAGKHLIVDLYSAPLLRNEVTAGPFQATTMHLDVTP